MVSSVPLRALAAFEATARLSSVARAAGELGISSSAISQHIKWLESHLQRQLFNRGRRPMVLSEAGDRLFHAVTNPFADIHTALDRLELAPAAHSLALRTPPSLTAKWLVGQVGDFRAAHPNVELRMEATNEYIEFDWTGFDLDIRAGNGQWPGLFAHPLMDEVIMPLCHPDLLAAAGATGRGLDDAALSRQTLIHSSKAPTSWRHWFQASGLTFAAEPAALTFDRSFLSIAAATQGLGVCLESTFLAAREIAAGTLVPAMARDTTIPCRQHWLVCPDQRLRVPMVRTFIEWLWQRLPGEWRCDPPAL